MSVPRLTRRSLFRGLVPAVAAGVAGFVWARASVDAEEATNVAANSYGPAESTGDTPLAKLSEVPDGGGIVVEEANVVIVRDGEDIHAFSAICTHQGCIVSSVEDGSITCPCHGSVFDAGTGEPTQGPATRPLTTVAVQVQGEEIVRS